MSEAEKKNLMLMLLSIIGYGSFALGIAITYSAWYVGYESGIPLGAGVLVLGIIVTAIWYFMKKKEGGS